MTSLQTCKTITRVAEVSLFCDDSWPRNDPHQSGQIRLGRIPKWLNNVGFSNTQTDPNARAAPAKCNIFCFQIMFAFCNLINLVYTFSSFTSWIELHQFVVLLQVPKIDKNPDSVLTIRSGGRIHAMSLCHN